MDGVSLTKSRGALSSDGVYVSLSNTRRDCKHFQSFVGTLFLVPPGVDTLSLLEFVSADILKLQRGVRVYDVALDKWRMVRGVISMLPTDHTQAIKTTRGLGTAANITSRCCWALKETRCNPRILATILDHTMTRREAQTDVCVLQMNETLSRGRHSKARVLHLQRKYGIRSIPRHFHGLVSVDTHLQSFWDPAHLLFLNILPRLVESLWKACGKLSHLFVVRMSQFPWVRGTKSPSRPWRKGLGRSVSISIWRQYILASIYACEGFVRPHWVEIITNYWKLTCLVLGGAGLSVTDLDEAQRLCDLVIRGMLRHGGKKKKNSENLKFDLPCVHGLRELVFRTLPALRNGNFSSTNSFETHHKEMKVFAVGGTREMTAISCWLVYEAMQRCLHGMRRGPGNRFRLGSGWTPAVLKDPVFLSLTPFSGRSQCDEPPRWTRTLAPIKTRVSQACSDLILQDFQNRFPTVHRGSVTLTMISGLVRHNGASTEELRQGDAVEVRFEDELEEAYAVLQGPFVEASWGDVVDFYIFPAWYDFERVITTNVKKTHPLRGTKLLRRWMGSVAQEPPIRASEIVNRVHVVHSCKRTCSYHELPANCRCADNCYVRNVCKQHKQENCAVPECVGKPPLLVDWHNPRRNLYEVLSQTQGISFSKRRLFYADDVN